MMQFKYVGEEPCEVFGLSWLPGQTHDVADEHAIRKLTHHHLFEAVGSQAPKTVKGKAAKAEKSDGDADNG